MDTLKMNEASGRMLYELCQKNMRTRMMDYFDFIEEVGIQPELMNGYFQGARDLPKEHLIRIAALCRVSHERLGADIAEKFMEESMAKRARNDAEANRGLLAGLSAAQQEEKARQKALKAKILDELREYGIDSIAANKKGYALDSYRPLKFVLHFLHQEEYLPKLEALLQTCGDQDLLEEGATALMWAAGTKLAYEKLLLLKERKEFIAGHIRDRGREGVTALHYAAGGSDDAPAALRLLIEWGADVNAQDDFLWTPLHFVACRNGWNDGAWLTLVEAGALSSKNSDGDTPQDIENRLDALDAW